MALEQEDIEQVTEEVGKLLEPQIKAINDLGSQVKSYGDIKTRLDKIETMVKRAPNDLQQKDRSAEREAQRELWVKATNAFARKAITGETLAQFCARNDEFKTLSVGSDPDGGFLVTPALSNRIETITPAGASDDIRSIFRVETISTDAFEEPNDTGRPSVAWVSEIGTRGTSSTAQFGVTRIPTHEIYARPMTTQKMLDDARFNVEGWMQSKTEIEFRAAEGSAVFQGDGNGKPKGLLAGTNFGTAADDTRTWGVIQYIPTTQAAAFGTGINAPDVFDDCIAQLKTEYRSGAEWLMNRTTFATVSKMKDTTGNSTVVYKLSEAVPQAIRGYPVRVVENMPSIGTDSYSIAFGNFKRAYCVVDRIGVRTLRDPYSSPGFVTFLISKRVGGELVNSEAVKVIKFGAS
jgi:HK97 family phage major capsid protein